MTRSQLIKKKVQLRIKWKWNDFKGLLGFSISMEKYRGVVRVVCFHGVCPDSKDYINSRFLHCSKFEALMDAFAKQFHVLSLDEFLENKCVSDRPNVLITFDDGYKNNRDLALPILEKHSLPATIFCTNQHVLWMDLFDIARANGLSLSVVQEAFPEIGSSEFKAVKVWAIRQGEKTLERFTDLLHDLVETHWTRFMEFHELLTDNDLEFMQKHPLISIANHGAAHLSYTNQSREDVANDALACKERLERIGSPYGHVFAYPFGHYNPQIQDQLSQLGVFEQFATDGDADRAIGCHDRMTINPHISIRNQLLAICNGRY